MFIARMPFVLPSESETGFPVSMNPESTIECPLPHHNLRLLRLRHARRSAPNCNVIPAAGLPAPVRSCLPAPIISEASPRRMQVVSAAAAPSSAAARFSLRCLRTAWRAKTQDREMRDVELASLFRMFDAKLYFLNIKNALSHK